MWTKSRSSVQCWVRLHKEPTRWLMYQEIDGQSTEKQQTAALQSIVEQARNCEWDAACTFRQKSPTSGNWLVGLISPTRPTCEHPNIRKLPEQTVARASGTSRDDSITVRDEVTKWAKKHNTTLTGEVYSLSAQSFQCWEWTLSEQGTTSELFSQQSIHHRISERIFEMRDIALYPLIVTAFTLAMLGTGNSSLFGVGIFSIILLSGAHKFVFLHQREDATQESHLQNY